jgi:hypothetical protein
MLALLSDDFFIPRLPKNEPNVLKRNFILAAARGSFRSAREPAVYVDCVREKYFSKIACKVLQWNFRARGEIFSRGRGETFRSARSYC